MQKKCQNITIHTIYTRRNKKFSYIDTKECDMRK